MRKRPRRPSVRLACSRLRRPALVVHSSFQACRTLAGATAASFSPGGVWCLAPLFLDLDGWHAEALPVRAGVFLSCARHAFLSTLESPVGTTLTGGGRAPHRCSRATAFLFLAARRAALAGGGGSRAGRSYDSRAPLINRRLAPGLRWRAWLRGRPDAVELGRPVAEPSRDARGLHRLPRRNAGASAAASGRAGRTESGRRYGSSPWGAETAPVLCSITRSPSAACGRLADRRDLPLYHAFQRVVSPAERLREAGSASVAIAVVAVIVTPEPALQAHREKVRAIASSRTYSRTLDTRRGRS